MFKLGRVLVENEKVINLKARKPFKLNISIIVILVILIYIICCLVIYLSKDKIVAYEVNQGSLVIKNTYRGFIVRDEVVKYSKDAGNINYFVREGQKLAVNEIVYSVDNSGKVNDIISQIGSEKTVLSDEDVLDIKNKLSNFKLSYTDSNFENVYAFKSDLNESITDYLNENVMDIVNDKLDDMGDANAYTLVNNNQTGVVVYGVDGYENFKTDAITNDIFNEANYRYNNLKNKTYILANAPAYKLVVSEKWSVIIQLNDTQLKLLKNKTTVNITFLKDNLSCSVPISIIENKTGNYAKLDFDKYMIRYVRDRFIDIEINESSIEGFKVPNSSIIQKELFTIPEKYYQSLASKDKGFVTKNTDGDFVTISPTIYYHKDGNYYVKTDEVTEGTILYYEDEAYAIGSKETLDGVFCINKGYAVFKVIEKLDSDNEYTIVKTKTSYGLSLYDHIILNAQGINEEEIIY